MMNAIALCLVLTSLAAGGVWSPTPKKQEKAENDVIVKDGHRVVVVEYDQEEQPITKVLISPEDQPCPHFVPIEKLKEASSVHPNSGHDSGADREWRSPKELICDAYGKCKHKIADAIEKTKETAQEAFEKKKRGIHKVEESAEKATEKVLRMAYEAVDKELEVAHKVKEAAEGAYDKAKESVRHTAHEMEEAAEGAYDRAKESVQKTLGLAEEAKDLGKTIGVDVAQNVSGFFVAAGKQIMKRAVMMSHVASAEGLNLAFRVLYVLEFSLAYGTCVWVTFASSHVLAGAMPRQQFGVVQSKLYPVYFRTMACTTGLALLGFLVSHRGRLFTSSADNLQFYNLSASLLMIFVNLFYLEPKATKVMFEKMKVEKEEGRGREKEEVTAERQSTVTDQVAPSTAAVETETAEQEAVRSQFTTLNGRLKKLNTLSSFLNILCLVCHSCHVYYVGQRLHLTN